MAVSTNGKIWKFAAAADAKTGHYFISHMRWVKPTTAAHDLLVSDTAGGEVAAAAVDTGVSDQVIPMYGQSVNGIVVTTMRSGTLYIYVM